MTSLCPTCNNTLDRKHSAALGEEMLRCRVCKRFSVEDCETWLHSPDITHLRALAKIRDEAIKRHKLMMESPVTHPAWTDVSPA